MFHEHLSMYLNFDLLVLISPKSARSCLLEREEELTTQRCERQIATEVLLRGKKRQSQRA